MKKLITATLSALLLGSAAARAEGLCERKIEGVSVNMSLNEARQVWASQGYQEAPVEPQRGRGRQVTNQTLTMTNALPVYSPGQRRDVLTWMDTGTAVEVKRSLRPAIGTEESDRLAKRRIAEFCPNGQSRKSPLFCVGMFNGDISPGSTRISIEPSSAPGEWGCAYDMTLRDGFQEKIRRQRVQTRRPSKLQNGVPVPSKN